MTSPTQNDCHSFQLIDGKGVFNEGGLQNFITATNFSNCGVDYAVIAIMGPQSSGKSTFMNHFSGTNFEELNSHSKRNQTTRGVWIAKCISIHQPFTIAMDIEGTDGAERGEDTGFEGQSALFALAVADILIVNLWSNGIGQQNAACIPLLQTILEIRMRMDTPRKAKLCFILRDKTTVKTTLEDLEIQIKSTMETIWTTIARSKDFERTNISDFFHVLVFGLPHYIFERKEFEDQVAELRGKLLSLDREVGVVPAVAFQANAQELWKSIKQERFLNLPAHSEMIAQHMCKQIANTCLDSLTSRADLMELMREVEAGPVNEFGEKLHCLMESTLSNYLSEVKHFKEQMLTIKEREKVLKSEILKILHPLYVTMLGHVRNETFQEFKMRLTELQRKGVTFVVAYKQSSNICKKRFEEQCKDVVEKLSAGWDWLGCYRELCNEIGNYAFSKLTKEHVENITVLKGKEQGMSVGTGIAIATATGMALGAIVGVAALPVLAAAMPALVAAVPALAAAVPAIAAAGPAEVLAAGAITGTTAAVVSASAGLTAVLGNRETIQDAIALEKERHQQLCHELFHGGQPSKQ